MGDYYFVKIKIDEPTLSQIMNDLEKAQETISRCYEQLRELGILVLEKGETASGN